MWLYNLVYIYVYNLVNSLLACANVLYAVINTYKQTNNRVFNLSKGGGSFTCVKGEDTKSLGDQTIGLSKMIHYIIKVTLHKKDRG